MAVFYDTHGHLDYPDFAADLGAVLERAQAAGIEKMITIGTDLESSRRALDLADKHPAVYAVVGWHPNHVSSTPEGWSARLRDLAAHPKVVALGETGLDYYRLPQEGERGEQERLKAKQREVFEEHLVVAAELGLNCVIHQRQAFAETLEVLERYAPRVRGVFHCFVDGPAEAQRVLSLGSLVSFTGIVTFKNAEVVRETVRAVPLDKFMLETDCPFLAPLPNRGKRCEPAYVRDIADRVASVRGCSLEELSQKTCATAEEFFVRLRV